MIDLYSWYTSNGRKISIALEELELPYRGRARRHHEGRAEGTRLPRGEPEREDPGDRRSRRRRAQADGVGCHPPFT